MPKSKNKSPAVPDAVLRELAELAHVPPARRKSFFDAIRTNVQAAWELDGIAKGGLANRKGRSLHRAALTLYDNLGNLKPGERALIEGVLSSSTKFNFDRISGEGVGELRQTTYELARLFGLVTGKLTPRHPQQSPQSRQGGKETVKHPRFQKFVCDLLISATAADGNLTLDVNGGSGTLIDALEKLARYLPDGFDPSSLSLTTLKRLKAQCKAGLVDQT
jgi:hypothetical protein